MNKKTPKPKKYTLTLSERESARLVIYADSCGISRPLALGLFDTLQIDIFNNTAVVNNKE